MPSSTQRGVRALHGVMGRSRGYTLIELVLAMSLCTVLLAVMCTAITLHLRFFEAGRSEVESAQLARALLGRIGADLRRAAPAVGNPMQHTDLSPRFIGGPHSLEFDVANARRLAPRQADDLDGADEARAAEPSLGVLSTIRYAHSAMHDAGSRTPTGPMEMARVSPNGAATLNERDLPSETDRESLLWRDETPRGSAPQVGWDDRSIGKPVPLGTDATSASEHGSTSAAHFDDSASSGHGVNLDVLGPSSYWQVPEVAALNLRYFDGQEWTTHWDSASRGALPRCVEVQLVLRPANRRSAATIAREPDDSPPLAIPPDWRRHRLVVHLLLASEKQKHRDGRDELAADHPGAAAWEFTNVQNDR